MIDPQPRYSPPLYQLSYRRCWTSINVHQRSNIQAIKSCQNVYKKSASFEPDLNQWPMDFFYNSWRFDQVFERLESNPPDFLYSPPLYQLSYRRLRGLFSKVAYKNQHKTYTLLPPVCDYYSKIEWNVLKRRVTTITVTWQSRAHSGVA